MSGRSWQRALLAGAVLGAAVFGPGGQAFAGDDDAAKSPPAAAQPDNTARNKEERRADEPTADNQKNARPDRELAAEIRRAVVKDRELSTYAHNVKIIVQGGMATLKGPVRSEDERQKIEQMATSVMGAGRVTNELEIKPKK